MCSSHLNFDRILVTLTVQLDEWERRTTDRPVSMFLIRTSDCMLNVAARLETQMYTGIRRFSASYLGFASSVLLFSGVLPLLWEETVSYAEVEARCSQRREEAIGQERLFFNYSSKIKPGLALGCAAAAMLTSFVVNVAWLYRSPHDPTFCTSSRSLDCKLGSYLTMHLWTSIGVVLCYRGNPCAPTPNPNPNPNPNPTPKPKHCVRHKM
jgi:hypothetical protein